ncbi:MAG: AMP-binding protein, partial [Steroidobacteraceae bacterium]
MSRSSPAGWNCSESDTVIGILSRAALRHPEREYLDFAGEKFTYGEVDRLSSSLACGLIALGVKPGDTVVSMLDNNVDAVLSWYAINKAGGISVPLNTALKGEFLRHQISDAGTAIVLAEADYADRIAGLADALPELRTIAYRGELGSALAGSSMAAVRFDSLRNEPAVPLPAPPSPRDLTMLIYTSGTTGPSKGCMISHNYACSLARQAADCSGHSEKDCIWTALPLFHMNATATTVLSSALVGARAAIYPRFSLSRFWREIERTGATFASLLGSMIALIAQAEDTAESKRCYGQLRAVGGQPFPPSMQEAWKKRFGVQHAGTPGYGLTEASLMTSL